MRMLSLLKTLFTWWNGQTFGTWLYTYRYGKNVGADTQGNKYYCSKNVSGHQQRRWVIYNGVSESSRIPADWHAWIHYMIDVPPSDVPLTSKIWEKPHHENMTGTEGKYTPDGSLARKGHITRQHATGDYEAWSPDTIKHDKG